MNSIPTEIYIMSFCVAGATLIGSVLTFLLLSIVIAMIAICTLFAIAMFVLVCVLFLYLSTVYIPENVREDAWLR